MTDPMPTSPYDTPPPDGLHGLDPKRLLGQGIEKERPSGSAGDGDSPFVPPPADALDGLIPDIRILEFVGRGGMGAVYKAHHTALDRIVAVKILPPHIGRNPAFAERFSREAKSLARLSHPNIVAVFDAGHIDIREEHPAWQARPGDRLYYFVMEFIDGTSLRELLRDGKLSAEQALAIVPQICEALQFAHEAGIVHRDIKPDNILVDTRGCVKVADFGLAKLVGRNPQEATLTATHHVMGTPLYMAPEQHAWTAAVDHRADIYSLGVVFYEMLTGSLPVGRFDPPSKKVRVDVRLDEVVLRSLENAPERRYQAASEVKTAVRRIQESAGDDMRGHSAQGHGRVGTFLHRDEIHDPSGFIAAVLATVIFVLGIIVPLILANFRTSKESTLLFLGMMLMSVVFGAVGYRYRIAKVVTAAAVTLLIAMVAVLLSGVPLSTAPSGSFHPFELPEPTVFEAPRPASPDDSTDHEPLGPVTPENPSGEK